jgi:hypothetical protein
MKRRRLLPYLGQLWATDVGLTILLASLLIYIFVLHPLIHVGFVKLLGNILFSLILVSGTITVSKNRIFRSVVLGWALLSFIFLWVKYLFPSWPLTTLNALLVLIFLVLLTILILDRIFREGPTTSYRIMAAVAVYLLIGVTWATLYNLIALHSPETFNIAVPSAGDKSDVLGHHLLYFSFVTLTSIGYGDIVATHPTVRMLVALEGVVGQLFPAILIARLVSLHVQSKRKTQSD